MYNLIGTYDCKLDIKGRFMFPAPLKKQLEGEVSKAFVIKRSVFQDCLEIYPMNEWQKMAKKISSLNRFKKKNNDFIRRFIAGVSTVELDNAGRILIPKSLCEKTGLNKEIVISSAINIIEIWDKTKYEKEISDATPNFGSLAEDVMGENELLNE